MGAFIFGSIKYVFIFVLYIASFFVIILLNI